MTGAANSEENKNDAVGVKSCKRAKLNPKPKPKAVDSKGTHRGGTGKLASKIRDPIKGTRPMAEDAARVYNSAAVLPKANLKLVDSGGGSSSQPRPPPLKKPHTLEWKVSPPPPPPPFSLTRQQMPPSNYVMPPVVQYPYGVPEFAPMPEYGNKNVAFVGSQENIQGGPTIMSEEEAEPNLTTTDINDETILFFESLESDENFQSLWNSVGPSAGPTEPQAATAVESSDPATGNNDSTSAGPTEPQAATAVESSDPAAGNNDTTSAGILALEDSPLTGLWDF